MAKIMILEDDIDIRTVMSIVLSEQHEVIAVDDLENWMSRILENSPELIIIDILLGVVNGIEVAKWVKSNPYTSKTKVVLTTASVRKLSNDDGFDAYLEKPFEISDLQNLANKLMSQRTFS
ncbi:response regulator [Pedobacter sp. AW1-32]|uniref:response regulator n=1 Tax=Pedobacter sp. AW1-32 TaxID=3383026 RepID=UPI003FEE2D5A